jgi:hypothetical protein
VVLSYSTGTNLPFTFTLENSDIRQIALYNKFSLSFKEKQVTGVYLNVNLNELKNIGREADHSPPSSAEVKE